MKRKIHGTEKPVHYERNNEKGRPHGPEPGKQNNRQNRGYTKKPGKHFQETIKNPFFAVLKIARLADFEIIRNFHKI
jgi:hypothetical protein